MRNAVHGALSVVLLVTSGCGGSGTTSPTAITTGPTPCRNYASASSTLTTTLEGAVSTQNLNCSFSTSVNRLDCATTLSVCGTVNFSVNYASVGDFIDEVSVIPPRMLQQSQTTNPNGCGITDGTYSYDGQKRLVRYTINGLTYSYSAWDSSSRPTAGTVSGGVSESWTYNDSARTATRVQSSNSGSTTTVYTYDANGNPTSVMETSGLTVVTSTTNTNTTAQVCR
jgi:YD repeat-containing protein